jgi:hypothetical protein
VVSHPSSSLSNPMINGDGTSEFEWEAAEFLGTVGLLDLKPCARPAVVAPHPDPTVGLGRL